jgi:hypothetical protein
MGYFFTILDKRTGLVNKTTEICLVRQENDKYNLDYKTVCYKYKNEIIIMNI